MPPSLLPTPKAAVAVCQNGDHSKPTDEGKINLADLKRKSVRGGTITLVSQAISTVVHLASTVILARMLTPADYGIIAMVTAITAFAGLFRDLGLSSAAIQKKDLTAGQQTNLFWLNVAMGTALTLILAVCSPLVAWFYRQPELTLVTFVLSLNFIIGSLGAQHQAMLVRNLQFFRKAIADISGSLVTLVIAIGMAYQGYAYWALAVSSIAGGVVTSALLFYLSPFWPGLPRRGEGIREMVSFGANITGFNIVNYFHRNLDNILIGRFWGVEALGVYSRAYALLMFPIQAIRSPINAVAFPALSKLQGQPRGFREFYVDTTMLIATFSMPICFFLFMTSYEVVFLTLGPQWHETADVFRILALVGVTQPSTSTRGMVVLALGNGSRYLAIGVFQSVIVSIGFIIGVNFGVMGVAWAYVTSSYLAMPFMFYLGFRETPVRPRDYLIAAWQPLLAAVTAFVITLVVKQYGVSSELSTWAALLLLLIVYTVVYTVSLVVISNRIRAKLYKLAKCDVKIDKPMMSLEKDVNS